MGELGSVWMACAMRLDDQPGGWSRPQRREPGLLRAGAESHAGTGRSVHLRQVVASLAPEILRACAEVIGQPFVRIQEAATGTRIIEGVPPCFSSRLMFPITRWLLRSRRCSRDPSRTAPLVCYGRSSPFVTKPPITTLVVLLEDAGVTLDEQQPCRLWRALPHAALLWSGYLPGYRSIPATAGVGLVLQATWTGSRKSRHAPSRSALMRSLNEEAR